MLTQAHVDAYLQSRIGSWSLTTMKSETARLNTIMHSLRQNSTPRGTFDSLKAKLGHYSTCTAWTRLCAAVQWTINRGLTQGLNEYRIFREDNGNLFKNAYERRTAPTDMADAMARVRSLPSGPARDKLEHLLTCGLRYAESLTHKDGSVLGKGGRSRRVLSEDGPSTHASYRATRRACRSISLKPHDLRKIFATELWRRGLREVEICELMGWASFDTARFYVAPLKHEEIKIKLGMVG